MKTNHKINGSFLTISLFIVLFGCNSKKEIIIHEDLIGYKSEFIGELEDENFIKHEQLAENKNVKSKQVDDLLIIETWRFVNACGRYQGNIPVKIDTIKLELLLLSDEVCTSISIDKLTYIFNNPNGEKWIIK